MKAVLLPVLLAIALSNVYSQRLLERPDYKFRNTGIYRINKIELSGQATHVQLVSEFLPGWWVTFSKEKVYLKSSETGELFRPIDVEGIKWGQKKPTPQTGRDTFDFTFPPLPSQLKTIDWIDEENGIYGICLKAAKKGSIPPVPEYAGNWHASDNTHQWTYGFYKDFAIIDQQFWEYTSVHKKGNTLILDLKSDQKQRRLMLTPQKDGSCKIGPSKRLQKTYRQKNFISSSSQHDTTCKEPFFQAGSKAHIQGYIQGYDPRAGFKSGLVYCKNAVSNEDFPTVVELLPDGRFFADLPLDHPTLNYIVFGRKKLQFYIEPQDTLTLFIDWEDWLLGDKYRNRRFYDFKSLRFMGPDARTNAELIKVTDYIGSEGSTQFPKQARELAPLAFREQALRKLGQKLKTLDSLHQIFHFSTKTLRIAETKIKNNIAGHILDFAMTRKYFKSGKPDKILDLPVTEEYYDFMKQLPLNDPFILISTDSWISRFEYAPPFDVIYNHPSMQNQDPVKNTLAFWHLKDSIYSNYFKLDPSLCYEVIKLRKLSSQLKHSLPHEKADSIVQIYLKGLSNPYLQFKATQLAEQYILKQIPLSTPLPDNKSAAIFRRLIAPYTGKVIHIDFWSTGCAPCRTDITNTAPLREKYKDKDLVFLFITDDKSSPLKAYNEFIAGVEGEKLRLSADEYNYLQELFRFNGIPHYETINKAGEVVNQKAYGKLSQEDYFDKLLEE